MEVAASAAYGWRTDDGDDEAGGLKCGSRSADVACVRGRKGRHGCCIGGRSGSDFLPDGAGYKAVRGLRTDSGFDPSSPEEAYEMIQDAFSYSEKYKTPVLFRPTTRVCHAYASIENPVNNGPKAYDGFVKDSKNGSSSRGYPT